MLTNSPDISKHYYSTRGENKVAAKKTKQAQLLAVPSFTLSIENGKLEPDKVKGMEEP